MPEFHSLKLTHQTSLLSTATWKKGVVRWELVFSTVPMERTTESGLKLRYGRSKLKNWSLLGWSETGYREGGGIALPGRAQQAPGPGTG